MCIGRMVINRCHSMSVAVNLFVLGKRLGSLDENVPPDCQEFIVATNNFFAASQTLLFGLPFHKIYATKPYKTLLKSFKRIFEISMAHIKERLDELHEEELVIEGEEEGPPLGVDFLTYMSKAGKMSLENITTNAIDLLAAGVDTVSCVTCYMYTPSYIDSFTQRSLLLDHIEPTECLYPRANCLLLSINIEAGMLSSIQSNN